MNQPVKSSTPEEQFQKYLKDIKSGNRSVRQSAASRLGKLGDARAFEPLVEALHREEKLVKDSIFGTVAEALGELGDKRAVAVLLEYINEPEAVAALGLLQDVRAVEPLLKVLEYGDWDLSAEAAYALGELGDKRAVEPLIRRLQEGNDERERTAAAWALGELNDSRAYLALTQALQDDDNSVQLAALIAALNLGYEPTTTVLANLLKKTSVNERVNLVRKSRNLSPQAALMLLEWLFYNDEELWVRQAAEANIKLISAAS